jgi:HTH-type transcriptional regulator/antitoxin HigA
MIDIKIIKTEKEYEKAMARIDAMMDADRGSIQEEELELLALLVEKYEEEHFPIDPPDPVEAILFRMEQEGLTAKDMIKYLGSQSKVSEVLNHRRPLSLAMIRNLHAGLGIPLEVLVCQPKEQAEEGLVLTRHKTTAGIQP